MTLPGRDGSEHYFERWHHEDQLVNHRLTWLLAGEALVIGGYGQMLLQDGERIELEEQTIDGHVVGARKFTVQTKSLSKQPEIQALLSLAPILGMSLALAVFVGVAMAHRAQAKLAWSHGAKEPGVSFVSTYGGWSISLLLPVSFVGVWLVVLLGFTPCKLAIAGTLVSALFLVAICSIRLPLGTRTCSAESKSVATATGVARVSP